ncbi:MAG TPA: class I SAM-dependent rRNA methyltransferase [Spirochaetia bacterium]|nr:class I SAM-dependent rRNA methyltransferase [Spirochaetia bacterium]
MEKLTIPSGYLKGEGNGRERIEEDGVSFVVDLREGQKTGFYLDQRESRLLVKSCAAGKRVLNLFSYTGGFSLHALAGGALAVDSVDTSAAALALAKESAALNTVSRTQRCRWIKEDVFSFLSGEDTYDLVILDPPPFARSKGELPGALRGYHRLHEQAFRQCDSPGLLFTFSCSQAVSRDMLNDVLQRAASAAGRRARMVRELGAAIDHPVSVLHPEGHYLKGFMVYVA